MYMNTHTMYMYVYIHMYICIYIYIMINCSFVYCFLAPSDHLAYSVICSVMLYEFMLVACYGFSFC